MTVGGSGASDPPMSEEHRQVLRELNALLCDELDAVPVARDLYSRKVLERTHVEHIRNILPKPEQNWDLLSKLERSGDNAFWVFMEVLTKKQPHLAHQIDLRLSQGQREKTMERPPTNDDQLPDLKEDISQLLPRMESLPITDVKAEEHTRNILCNFLNMHRFLELFQSSLTLFGQLFVCSTIVDFPLKQENRMEEYYAQLGLKHPDSVKLTIWQLGLETKNAFNTAEKNMLIISLNLENVREHFHQATSIAILSTSTRENKREHINFEIKNIKRIIQTCVACATANSSTFECLKNLQDNIQVVVMNMKKIIEQNAEKINLEIIRKCEQTAEMKQNRSELGSELNNLKQDLCKVELDYEEILKQKPELKNIISNSTIKKILKVLKSPFKKGNYTFESKVGQSLINCNDEQLNENALQIEFAFAILAVAIDGSTPSMQLTRKLVKYTIKQLQEEIKTLEFYPSLVDDSNLCKEGLEVALRISTWFDSRIEAYEAEKILKEREKNYEESKQSFDDSKNEFSAKEQQDQGRITEAQHKIQELKEEEALINSDILFHKAEQDKLKDDENNLAVERELFLLEPNTMSEEFELIISDSISYNQYGADLIMREGSNQSEAVANMDALKNLQNLTSELEKQKNRMIEEKILIEHQMTDLKSKLCNFHRNGCETLTISDRQVEFAFIDDTNGSGQTDLATEGCEEDQDSYNCCTNEVQMLKNLQPIINKFHLEDIECQQREEEYLASHHDLVQRKVSIKSVSEQLQQKRAKFEERYSNLQNRLKNNKIQMANRKIKEASLNDSDRNINLRRDQLAKNEHALIARQNNLRSQFESYKWLEKCAEELNKNRNDLDKRYIELLDSEFSIKKERQRLKDQRKNLEIKREQLVKQVDNLRARSNLLAANFYVKKTGNKLPFLDDSQNTLHYLEQKLTFLYEHELKVRFTYKHELSQEANRIEQVLRQEEDAMNSLKRELESLKSDKERNEYIGKINVIEELKKIAKTISDIAAVWDYVTKFFTELFHFITIKLNDNIASCIDVVYNNSASSHFNERHQNNQLFHFLFNTMSSIYTVEKVAKSYKQISTRYFMPQLAQLGQLMMLAEISEDERKRIKVCLDDIENKIKIDIAIFLHERNRDIIATFAYQFKNLRKVIENDPSQLSLDN